VLQWYLTEKIHIGEKQFGGRAESAAYGITEDLINAGFESGRMKTGTPQEWMDVLWIFRK
jgi:tRNA uridine 5-carboxymethylaminomethyl modification enzyme